MMDEKPKSRAELKPLKTEQIIQDKHEFIRLHGEEKISDEEYEKMLTDYSEEIYSRVSNKRIKLEDLQARQAEIEAKKDEFKEKNIKRGLGTLIKEASALRDQYKDGVTETITLKREIAALQVALRKPRRKSKPKCQQTL